MTGKSIKFALVWTGNDPPNLATLLLSIEYKRTIAMVNIIFTQIKSVTMKINMIFSSSSSAHWLKSWNEIYLEMEAKSKRIHQTKNRNFFNVYAPLNTQFNAHIAAKWSFAILCLLLNAESTYDYYYSKLQ